ncbi:MAG: hypothetical protein IPM82_18270 [Saprospiraceae bacterium]|nr:hypothetical protein [Saprospiraceae bacterium]
MTVTEVFDDVAGLLAQMDPAKIVALKAPKMMAKRVEVLIGKKKDGQISLETSELERYLALDMLINLAKARAHRLLAA